MTVQEAIKELHNIRPLGGIIPQKRAEAIDMSIQALEEVEQYRALGTVEELKEAKMKVFVYEQIKWERDIAISQLEEIGISLGQKMDDIKEAREKQVAKKPIEKEFYNMPHCSCPICEGGLYYEQEYCDECGQALKWGEEDD